MLVERNPKGKDGKHFLDWFKKEIPGIYPLVAERHEL